MNDMLAFKKEQIKNYALKNGWALIYYNEHKDLYCFKNQEYRCFMDVWARSLRIVTCMNRQPGDYSCVQRDGIGLIELENIFKNPRFHTNRGKRIG